MKKIIGILVVGLMLALSSCNAIKVTTDYDSNVRFEEYKTFAFFKKGIDKADVSDLDKRRILRAIEKELLAQGFTKSSDPDFLVSIFTKSRERVNVNQNNLSMGWGWGWGWNPWMWGGGFNNVNVSQYTEGTLFIDFIETKKKELIWQGVGSGALRIQNREKKEKRIQLFVKEIVSRFPPKKE